MSLEVKRLRGEAFGGYHTVMILKCAFASLSSWSWYAFASLAFTAFSVLQETLFIIKNAKLFGTKASDIFQVVSQKGLKAESFEFHSNFESHFWILNHFLNCWLNRLPWEPFISWKPERLSEKPSWGVYRVLLDSMKQSSQQMAAFRCQGRLQGLLKP